MSVQQKALFQDSLEQACAWRALVRVARSVHNLEAVFVQLPKRTGGRNDLHQALPRQLNAFAPALTCVQAAPWPLPTTGYTNIIVPRVRTLQVNVSGHVRDSAKGAQRRFLLLLRVHRIAWGRPWQYCSGYLEHPDRNERVRDRAAVLVVKAHVLHVPSGKRVRQKELRTSRPHLTAPPLCGSGLFGYPQGFQ